MDILFLMKNALSAISPQETLFMKYVAVKRRANIAIVPYITGYDKLFLEYYESILVCKDIDNAIYGTLGDIPSILKKWRDHDGFIVKKYRIPTEGEIDVLTIPFKREFDEYTASYFDRY